MKLKHFGCFAFLFLAFLGSDPTARASVGATWDLNDVSYLFPLPTSGTDGSYLKARDFIPLTWISNELQDSDGYDFSLDSSLLFEKTKTEFKKIAADSFDRIRLVSVRIDPCFKDLFTDACRYQIRGVWQPVDAKFNAVDATMHTFYDLHKEEFDTLLGQLSDLKLKYGVKTDGLSLQVHPGFKKKGFSQDLFALLRTTFKPERLSRVAFMKLLGLEFQWRFLSFDLKNGKLIPIEIPLHGGTQQTFAVHGGGTPPGTLHLSDDDLARSRNGEELSKILLDYALRIENPLKNIPGVTDCLSCHASGGVKGRSATDLGMSTIPTVADEINLKGKYNLANSTKNLQDPIHFRAFGYVVQNPSLSDRLIIESAMVADALNAR